MLIRNHHSSAVTFYKSGSACAAELQTDTCSRSGYTDKSAQPGRRSCAPLKVMVLYREAEAQVLRV